MSIDEADELEDEIKCEFEGLPFIFHPDVISAYGERYTIQLDNDGIPVVSSQEVAASVACSLFRPR